MLCLSYKPDHTLICRGCNMGTYGSSFILMQVESGDEAVDHFAKLDVELDKDDVNFMHYLLAINEHDMQKIDFDMQEKVKAKKQIILDKWEYENCKKVFQEKERLAEAQKIADLKLLKELKEKYESV